MRYLIWGYYGYGNLGDELMLHALCEGIRRRDAAADLSVRCRLADAIHEPHITAFDVEAPRPPCALPQRLLRYLFKYIGRVLKKIKTSDVLVIGGGTLFIDKGRFNRSLLELWFFVLMARWAGKKVVAVGVGVDTLKHPISKLSFRGILRLVDGAWFRELYGYETARRQTGDSPAIHRSADLVYSLRWPHLTASGTRDHLGIVVADYHANYQSSPGIAKQTVIERLSAALSNTLETTSMTPRFLVFQAGTGFQGDALAREIIERMHLKQDVAVEILTPDLGALSTIFGRLKALIGMHYHALVLASLFDVPFIGISHERKFEDICAQFQMPCMALENLDRNAPFIPKTLAGLAYPPTMAQEKAKAVALSENNFDWMVSA